MTTTAQGHRLSAVRQADALCSECLEAGCLHPESKHYFEMMGTERECQVETAYGCFEEDEDEFAVPQTGDPNGRKDPGA